MIAPTLDCGGGGDCPDGQECLPDDYVAPCAEGEECLPDNYIDPADCPECTDCADTAELIVAGNTAENDQTTVTTSLNGGGFPLDTTPGSTIIVVVHTFQNGAYADGDVTDNKGNTYTLIGDNNNIGTNVGVGMWISERDGVRGMAHEFTFTGDATGPVMEVIELSGLEATALDATTAAGSTDSVSPFDVTAAAAIVGRQWSIYASTLDTSGDHAWGIPAGYTEIREEGNGSQHLVSMSCYKEDETGTPTVGGTFAGSIANATNLLLTFKIASCPACICGDCDCEGTYVPYCLGPENAVDADALILATTPWAYYLMDAAGALDISGNGRNGLSSVGTVSYGVSGITSKNSSGEATAFTNGANIAFPKPVVDMSSASYTWAAVLVMQVDAYNSGVGGNPGVDGGYPFFSLGGFSPPKMGHTMGPTGQLVAWYDSNFSRNGSTAITRDVVFAIGEPHVLLLNSSSIGGVGMTEFWMDGVLVMTVGRTGDGTDGTAFMVGRIDQGGPYFGAIDMTFSNFGLWDRVLTYTEIADISAALVDDAILATSWIPS